MPSSTGFLLWTTTLPCLLFLLIPELPRFFAKGKELEVEFGEVRDEDVVLEREDKVVCFGKAEPVTWNKVPIPAVASVPVFPGTLKLNVVPDCYH